MHLRIVSDKKMFRKHFLEIWNEIETGSFQPTLIVPTRTNVIISMWGNAKVNNIRNVTG